MAGRGWQRKVELRPLSSLFPHEDTDGRQTEILAAELRRIGIQRDPLIIDRKTGAVLDGMHRLAALAELKIGHAVCFGVEYGSKSIAVRRWARAYRAKTAGEIAHALEGFGFSTRVARVEAVDRLERRGTPVAAMTTDGSFLPRATADLESAFELVRRADSASLTAGWKQTFIPEDEIETALQDEGTLVLLVCRIDKQDVLNAAMTKTMFPCKTSLHIIDPRPVAANIPLVELREGSTKSLEARLRAAKFTPLPPNSTYGGRKYKERLLKLSDH